MKTSSTILITRKLTTPTKITPTSYHYQKQKHISPLQKKQRPKKAVTNESSLLTDTTDIFSDIPEAKSKEPKKKAKKVLEKKSVFKDDVGKFNMILKNYF